MAQEPMGGGEKTEKPTAKRLSEAAKNGDILQSRELATALVMMAGVAWLAVAGPDLVQALRDMLSQGLRVTPADISSFEPQKRIIHLLSMLVVPVGGILAVTLAAAIAAPALLGSLGFRTNAFAPKFNKLNPLTGLQRILGPQGLMELVKSIAKVTLLGSIGGWLVWERLQAILVMGKAGVAPAVAEIGSLFIVVSLTLAGALFLIAGIDVPAQIFQRAKRLNMTKQEVRDENKETEGSPEVKGAIRRKQYETLNNSVRKAVEESTVVLTNPTHFAVALRYHPGRDLAPMVVARGADEIARAMRALALEKGKTMLEYPELTRAIFYSSRVGQVIDDRLFVAVAAVLAFVFRVESRMASHFEQPRVDVPEGMRFDAEGRPV
jgi:flagellar biosynthetic protein FlhB